MSGIMDGLRSKPGVQFGDYYDALDDVREALHNLTDEQVDVIRETIKQSHVQMTKVTATDLHWCLCGEGIDTPETHDHERHIVRVIAAELAGGSQ